MAITTMDALVAAMATGDKVPFQKATVTGTANAFTSLWLVPGVPGAGSAPPATPGEIPTRSTNGAIAGWTDPAGGQKAYLLGLSIATDDPGVYMLYDRLAHMGGLSGTVITAQTVNTAALTRYTDGIGVEIWVEIYTALGATSRTITATYTNENDVTGRTTTAVTLGATPPASRMYPLPLQAGDQGVKSVQSVLLSATTGSAGNFGVTLVKRMADIPIAFPAAFSPRDPFDLGLPEIASSACLGMIVFTSVTAVGPALGLVNIARG